MSNFAVTISCKLNEDDVENTTFVLDNVNKSDITAISQVTTHPVANGDIVADHMYQEPISLSLSGTFSLNGSKGIVIDGAGARLENIQDLFEKIKNDGILCDIVKVQMVDREDGSQVPKFKLRKSMVLDSITWSEKINSLGFSFSFTQVLIADIDVVDLDITDENLPDITSPETLSFTDTLIRWEYVDEVIDKCLLKYDLMTSEFIQFLSTLGASTLAAIGVGLGIAALISTIGIATGGAALIIGAALGAVYCITKGIINFFKERDKKRKYRVETFKYYNDRKKMDKEARRFLEYKDGIYKELEVLNKAIKVYRVSSNSPQECILNIDDDTYDFMFTRNQTNQSYTLSLQKIFTDSKDAEVKNISDIRGSPTSIFECNDNNKLYTTSNKATRIYLINVNEEGNDDLTNYYMVTSTFPLEEYSKKLADAIVEIGILK